MSEIVLVEDRGAVRWISINRPDKRNAINEGVIAAIRTAIESADLDDDLRAIVLTGIGEKAFCAGADLGRQVEGGAFDIDYADPRHYVVGLFKAIEECRLPIIARVNGLALAGGFGLVCACDMAVAADDALFGTPETKIGIAPMMILGYMMRILPRRKLMEMCISGEFISAEEALQFGVINYVVPRAELDDKLSWLLDRITAKSPAAIKLFKQGYHAMQDMSLQECFEFAQIMISVMASTNDAKEGRLAFQEKRPPVWRSER
ncbi:MAG: enoyl-CoA hydratase/isomerase family protein [Desulfobulbaceae bacterium]|jgi:enoyl-CoA hydratase/carnithine racemase|nr:enoyl-CoA hydratase/isomerase family protein [Desulfobulbaceae bacterium]